MQTSMTYPAPTAASVTDDRCPPHAWITLRTTTSCSRCGTIDWSAAMTRDYSALNAGRPAVWDPSVPPGGVVCAIPTRRGGICGMPVESEPCHLHTEETPMTETPMTELAAENTALWALVEAISDALDLPVPATGGDAQQRYQQVLRERARAVRAVTAHATRTRSAAHSADVLRTETERTPVTYPSIAEEEAE